MKPRHPDRRRALGAALAAAMLPSWPAASGAQGERMRSWPLNTPSRTGIHDVAPASDGGVWFTAQRSGHLGWFDPKSAKVELIALGRGSSPHGVIQGPDGAAWLTDSGQNAVLRVGWPDRAVRAFPLPEGSSYANLNTAAFDGDGDLWFTGQSGIVGKVAVKSGQVSVKDAPKGRGPYGICATPAGEVWWCSLAGSFIARIDRKSGDSVVVEPPTKNQGARRVWKDSRGRIWVSEWNSGQLSVHDPAAMTPAQAWRAWKLPGDKPSCYAVYVDERDSVWASDFGGNAVWRFDAGSEKFERFGFQREATSVRQILGRPGEVWLPESGTEHISVNSHRRVRRALLRAWVALACALAAGACTTLAPLPPTPLAGDECTRWFAQLDAAVDAAGVRDAQDERVAGFEFVRVDRLAVATRDTAPLPQWLDRAAALDRQARDAEVANLPAASFPIAGVADAAATRARSQACRESLTQRVLLDSALQRLLQQRAEVPDRYAVSLRALGAYPLLRWPFFAGVQTWQNEHTQAVARWNAQPPPRLRLDPPADDADAPVFEIELRGGPALPLHDRFGVPAWSSRDAAVPGLDTTQPVVYRRSTLAQVGGHWLRQLVYTVWFTERPASSSFDLLSGTLDGVIVRLTLAPDGKPLMADSIHACGCWHQFYPAPGVALRDGAPGAVEWAFVPARLPPQERGQRLAVRLASGTHHVTGMGAPSTLPAERYTLRDENELRSLPLASGDGSRSLYAADGLVRGTERAERFLFWPMGLASAGAMRQWGHHATAFVGRRHFDDPNLLDSRFLLPVLPTP